MRTYTRRTLAERFWSMVDKEGPVVRSGLGRCWNWTGTGVAGYGVLQRVPASAQGPAIPQWYAHRLSWVLANGPIPDGLCICHRCDRRQCVNPAHLFLGTRGDNNADRNLKGRDGDHRGERNPNAKLTPEQVAQIRERYASGETQTALAAEFGISQPQISRLVRRTSYTGQRLSRKEQQRLG